MPKLPLDNDEIDRIILGIYMDYYSPSKLPKELYLATAKVLKKSLYDGFKANISNINHQSSDYELLQELRTNVYIFSGAKTYQQYKTLNSLITQDNEKLSYKVFKEKALNEFHNYNEVYLQTEYETAITSAQTARKFNQIQENIRTFPYIRYSAVIDDRTAEICRRLNGTTLPSSDNFWHLHVPPQHFNCRCLLEAIDKYEQPAVTNPQIVKRLEEYSKENVQDVFRMNPAIDKYIFSPKHPYFGVAPKDKKLAERNFNLPIPKKDAD